MHAASKGFTLTELMIVVGIIGILVTIMAPVAVNARDASRRTLCINNLMLIDRAKDQFVAENGGSTDVTPEWNDLLPFIKDGAARLYCPAAPAGDRTCSNCYRINAAKLEPECLVLPVKAGMPDHSLSYRPGG